MKQLLVIGAGTAGTMVVNRFRRLLDAEEWKITIVDPLETHYYQPGFLFIPFGMYAKNDVVKPKRDFIPAGVEVIKAAADVIEPDHNRVKLADGRILNYDFLVIATGTQTRPEETPGLQGPEWYRSIYDFYTIEGAVALAKHLRTWQGGRLVLNVVENPIKCPVAPLEFIMLADWFFHEQGHPRSGRADLRDPAVRRLHETHRRQIPGRYPAAEGYRGDPRLHGRACGSRG